MRVVTVRSPRDPEKEPPQKAATMQASTTTNRNVQQRKGLGANDLPDIYFETTTKKFKMSPEAVKREGGLSKSWKTEVLTRIEVGGAGMYMAWDGHRRPHCQEPRSKRRVLQNLARERKVATRNLRFSADVPHVYENDLVVCNEGMGLFHQIMSEEVRDSLDMERVFEELFDEMMSSTSVCERVGNVTRGAGYASMNQKLKGDKEVTAPQILAGTRKEDVIRMRTLTRMIRLLASDLEFDEPFATDTKRNREWASYLCEHFNLPTHDIDGNPCNVLEGITLGLSACNPPPIDGKEREPILFGTHIDQFNCSMPGYNVLFCYYEHFERDGRWYRVVVIGYSRSCISAFYRRRDAKDMLKNRLKSYTKYCMSHGRGSATLAVVPEDNKEGMGGRKDKETNFTIPFMDKVSGLYSAPATVLRRIATESIGVTLQTMCELILPMGWATTFSNIYPVLDTWARDGLPTSENYTVTLIDTLRDQHGSFVGGPGARYQPSFNFSVYERDIEEGLRTLLGVIIDINKGELSFSDRRLNQRLRSIYGLGDLGALHVLHLATMCGVINDTSFISNAHIAKGTTTWAKVRASYPLGESVLNRMMLDLAKELGVPPCFIENALCEFCRDCDDIKLPFSPEAYCAMVEERTKNRAHPRFPDMFVKGQSVFHLRRRTSGHGELWFGERKRKQLHAFPGGDWDIVEIIPGEDGNPTEHVTEPLNLPCHTNTCRQWENEEQSKKKSRVIMVTNKSKLRSEAGTDSKKTKVRLLPKVVHTGMGCHVGLEDRLQERQKQRLQKASGVMDEEAMDLILDPTFERHGKIYRVDPLFECQPRESGRKTQGFRLLDVYGATIKNLTYRHIDLRSTCIAILSAGGTMPQQPMKKKIKSYFRIVSKDFLNSSGEDDVSYKLYTASINWHTMSALTVKDEETTGLLSTGLVRYSSKMAYYASASDALRAVIVRTLVKVAKKREGTGKDPRWSQRLLPSNRLHVVLYENGSSKGNTDRIFGFLHFRKRKRVLSIPSDSGDLTRPWEDFVFDEYPHR